MDEELLNLISSLAADVNYYDSGLTSTRAQALVSLLSTAREIKRYYDLEIYNGPED